MSAETCDGAVFVMAVNGAGRGTASRPQHPQQQRQQQKQQQRQQQRRQGTESVKIVPESVKVSPKSVKIMYKVLRTTTYIFITLYCPKFIS